MPGDVCIVCGNNRAKDNSISLHRIPRNPSKRERWIAGLGLDEAGLRDYHRVCSRHFPNADAQNTPDITIGRRFASPKKQWTSRAERAKTRDTMRTTRPACEDLVMTPAIGERADVVVASYPIDHSCLSVDELHSKSSCSQDAASSEASIANNSQYDRDLVSTALLAKIEAVEAKIKKLEKELCVSASRGRCFTVEDIASSDELVKLYTGFPSYEILLAFYEFLGPAVDELKYWGEKDHTRKRQRKRKLIALDQLLLTLMKLRLNLVNKDLGVRFGISESLVSRYVCTWVCFLYQHLNEIKWTPSVEQVTATMPHAFREKYPTTFAIIDGSEIFLETPNDLHLQSSTWSNYKHHNTAKFLIACTPNGVISYVSPLYVGGISDVELTRVSGFLQTLKGKDGISIMADRGFTIKDQLKEVGVELNMPPFLDGRSQLLSEEIKVGRGIASLRIHIERAIGRIKQFRILQGTFPLSMIRLFNQVVCVCAC